MNTAVDTTNAREIRATRVFNAPRELVFDAWTSPEHIAHWWGPLGFTTTTKHMDVRAGGEWLFVMHGPDGRDYPNRIVYIDVLRPERLEYRHADDGETEPVNFHVVVTFRPRGANTVVDMCMTFPSAQERERVVREYGAIEGLEQTLSRLAGFVERS